MRSDSTPKTLAEAEPRFQDFLGNQGWPQEIVWLQRGDLLFAGRQRFWVRDHEGGSSIARTTYVFGLEQGLGIKLEAVCADDAITFGTVFVPRNKSEAENLMCNGLKFSVPVERARAQLVRNRLAWALLKIWGAFKPRAPRKTIDGYFDSIFGKTVSNSPQRQ